MFAAAGELEMVASIHVGSSSVVHRIAPDSHFIADESWGAVRPSATLLAFLFSGVFTRLPGSQGGALRGRHRLDAVLPGARRAGPRQTAALGQRGLRYRNHAGTDIDLDTLDIRALFRDHIYGCFIEDAHGLANIDAIGVDNVMCETDYPHSDSTWPNSIDVVKRQIGHLPPDVQYKVLRGNAERLYRFTPAPEPQLAGAS